ncbi:hypothetical protein BDV95DRAFT_606944 [Massariosphaeria phaeospora]|uniref:Uncharacterized protein n=1 Tax=Massariosphaeria phaeospora TaxID=100035 RepID=A0A7C8MNW3_9PLEO|nr:hypothetical protein BDV95DRAFT_606944 [Massariosphaeria phaeospora]
MEAYTTPIAEMPQLQSHHPQPPNEVPTTTFDAALVTPEPKHKEPLYTEINIPLPPLPKPRPTTPKTRPRGHTLASYSPFRHKRNSSNSSTGSSKDSRESEEWPRIKKEVKNKDVAAMMNLSQRHRLRSGTIDALAVVPTVLVLSAELFTPGIGERKESERGNWEDILR